ncbi:uncharacterized protein LOC133193903 [Saccostrea echinata]|uniref:uncharacterized protein LOC133193903 n=1 Tax=Saccostrea echinata TaxID=191078 RepID=UPI002A82DDF6|nr:uncharacterized protein LOC133193903 [Saccostrea echinata]
MTPLRLIVGYMRGGTTLTADIVRHTEEDFYMFEPLHGVSQAIRRNSSTQFLNGTERWLYLTNFHRYAKDMTPLRLIVGYMRGGSTLTADIVRHTEGDFYMFEPLHGVSQAMRRNSSTQFLNGTVRKIFREEQQSVYPELLYHWFTCNFDHIDIASLTNHFILFHTPELKDYYYCLRTKRSTKTKNKLRIVKMCSVLLRIKCRTAATRTIKTIRLSIYMAGKLLKWLPNLKIIYLLRDPRGIINSQFERKINEGKNVSFLAKELCNTISYDLNNFDNLEHCHKSRMMKLIYENLCQYPHRIVAKIYAFLNIDYTWERKLYVQRIMKGPVRRCSYCTDRGNALRSAYRWISVINENTLNITKLLCSFLYTKLGYQHLEYHVLNLTSVSWKPLT